MSYTQPDLSTVSETSATEIDILLDLEFYQDRYLGDTLVLPYSWDEIKIKPNELATSPEPLNISIEKLYHNFLYLNNQCKLAYNVLPYEYYAKFTGGSITSEISNTLTDIFRINLSASKFYKNDFDSIIDNNSIDMLWNTSVVIQNPITPNINLIILGTNYEGSVLVDRADAGDYIKIIEINTTSADLTTSGCKMVENTRSIETGSDNLFSSISSIAITSKNELIVCDTNTNLIYKFDIKNFLYRNDAITNVGRYLINTFGGFGDARDIDKFNRPTCVRVGKDDKIYILDKDNSCYKIYDVNFNWIKTIYKPIESKDNIIDMLIDNVTEDVYLLTQNKKLYIFNDEGISINTILLNDGVDSGEYYVGMKFSQIDDNILYVYTNKHVYKKFKTKLDKYIGIFEVPTMGSQYIANLSVVNSNDDTDLIYVFTYEALTGLRGAIFLLKEKSLYRTTIYDNFKNRCFTLDQIKIKPGELLTDWVINKAFHKLLYNHMIFKENIHSKFVGEYNSIGKIIYQNIQYINEDETHIYDYDITVNNYVGINEGVLTPVINRLLENVYNIQTGILSMCQERITNVYPYNNQIVTL